MSKYITGASLNLAEQQHGEFILEIGWFAVVDFESFNVFYITWQWPNSKIPTRPC